MTRSRMSLGFPDMSTMLFAICDVLVILISLLNFNFPYLTE